MASLQFKGKAFVQNHHLTVKHHELVPCKAKSLTPQVSLHDNVIIHGDNLKALKALLPTFAGKIKCIYIDLPYNTGNEHWCYNDNVNSPMMQEWLGKEVDREDLTRHDKWLCMMLPRLKLLRELLRDDGVIFISIDDNEVHHLRMLMDEVFGEENHLANVLWQKRTSPDARAFLGPAHDFVVLYARRIESFNADNRLLPLSEERREDFKNPDNDPKGPWASVDMTGQTGHATPEQFYAITSPKGKKLSPPEGRCWAFAERTFKSLMSEGRVWFGANGEARPRLKRYLSEVVGTPVWTWWPNSEVGHNQEATRELNEILGKAALFENPKPCRLLTRIIQLATAGGDLVLDSFAGSGTTAHAVLALNKEDGGNRRFVLVECEDYADKITAERIRRVIKGVPTTKDEALKKGLGGTFSYFELGKPVDAARLFKPKELPAYEELARYVFFTATGVEFDPAKLDESRSFIGATNEAELYLFYKPDIEYLKTAAALTLERAKALGKPKGKRRMVFAPTKYLDQDHLEALRIDYAQLPFEIYKLAE